jgi:hypothetical protein
LTRIKPRIINMSIVGGHVVLPYPHVLKSSYCTQNFHWCMGSSYLMGINQIKVLVSGTLF